MLKVPAAGEATPPLVGRKGGKVAPVSLPESFQRAQEKRTGEPVTATAPLQPAGEMRTRRRHHVEQDQPDWEKVQTEKLVRVGKPRRSRKGIWVLAGVAVVAVVAALILTLRREKPVERIAVAPIRDEPVEIKESEPEKIDLPEEMNRNETELVAELEPLTKRFLEAKTVEELLPTVRDSKRLEPKIRAYYPDGKVPAPGMSAFNAGGMIAYRGKLASVTVRTGEFADKQLAFLRTDEGLKVDWESFVGWSEMSWERFIAEKPDRPVLFRVGAKLVDYYNFGFSDEKEWQSYELRSPDGEHVLYGYAKRDSTVDGKLRPADPRSASLVTLRMKFLPGEISRNQVVVDEIVTDGWVEGVGQ